MVLFLKKMLFMRWSKKMTNFRIEPTLPFTSPVNKVQFDKQCSLLKDGVMETFGKKRWKLLRTRSLAMNLKSFLLSACFILKVFFVCVQTFIENIFPAVHGCNCSEWKSICIFCALLPRQPCTLYTHVRRSRTADTNRDTDLEATPRPAKDGLRASLCQETRLAHCHTGEMIALLLY